MGRLDAPTPLGYSSAGIVEECGLAASEFSPGDRVACVGQGFASHAEFISVPVNLACRIPDGVREEEAAFGMLGIIALHGIRSAQLSFGSRVVVMGLGLLGLLTVQMLRAYGCEVIAYDPIPDKVILTKQFGFSAVTDQISELSLLSEVLTQRQGVDAVIITASTKKREPVDQAIQLCRLKGRIVVVGVADIHPDRNELWQKEIELVVSKAAGPGSLDPLYELEGIDLPIGEVRWTQRRNLEEFLRLLSQRLIDVQPLLTHSISLAEAETTYQQLMEGTISNPIGVLLEYPEATPLQRILPVPQKTTRVSQPETVQLGVIGAGLFGKALLLPALTKLGNAQLHTLVTNSGANVEHYGKKFGFAHQATDTKAVWENPEIHAIVGLTPHSNHAALVQTALLQQSPLFLEKPLCVTSEELHSIRETAAAQISIPLILVGHNRRFSPHTRQIQQWLQNRQTPLVVQMRVNAGFIPADHWVHSEDEGRSRIVGEMSHFIDLLQALSGTLVKKVIAERVSADNHAVINNDNVVISLKFLDGSVGNLTYSAAGAKAYSRERIEVFCEGQTLVLEDFRESKSYGSRKTKRYKTTGQEMGYREELQHFVNCVACKEEPLVTFTEALSTMETVFAIEQSLATGKPVVCKLV
jgi:predicted dehydrogenase/threonine dehydrogenase-like Zn-dependent dehydrogenase